MAGRAIKTLRVELNGTSTNPYKALYNLLQNPFPQVADYEYSARCLRLQSLGGEPIPHHNYEEYIRHTLEGFSVEFIQLCIDNFVPGKMVKFEVKYAE